CLAIIGFCVARHTPPHPKLPPFSRAAIVRPPASFASAPRSFETICQSQVRNPCERSFFGKSPQVFDFMTQAVSPPPPNPAKPAGGLEGVVAAKSDVCFINGTE